MAERIERRLDRSSRSLSYKEAPFWISNNECFSPYPCPETLHLAFLDDHGNGLNYNYGSILLRCWADRYK